MLVVSRKPGEEVVIGTSISVTVVAVSGQTVRLGFTAPETVPIHRKEVCPLDEETSELFFLLPAKQAEALECAARDQGLTVGQMVRRLVRNFLHSSQARHYSEVPEEVVP